MHSWIFRHHDELSRLYGASRSASPARPVSAPTLGPAYQGAFHQPQDPRHGRILRRRRYVVLLPMPPR